MAMGTVTFPGERRRHGGLGARGGFRRGGCGCLFLDVGAEDADLVVSALEIVGLARAVGGGRAFAAAVARLLGSLVTAHAAARSAPSQTTGGSANLSCMLAYHDAVSYCDRAIPCVAPSTSATCFALLHSFWRSLGECSPFSLFLGQSEARPFLHFLSKHESSCPSVARQAMQKIWILESSGLCVVVLPANAAPKSPESLRLQFGRNIQEYRTAA